MFLQNKYSFIYDKYGARFQKSPLTRQNSLPVARMRGRKQYSRIRPSCRGCSHASAQSSEAGVTHPRTHQIILPRSQGIMRAVLSALIWSTTRSTMKVTHTQVQSVWFYYENQTLATIHEQMMCMGIGYYCVKCGN